MLECCLAYLGLYVAVRDVLAASCRYNFAGPVGLGLGLAVFRKPYRIVLYYYNTLIIVL